jgi:hypothetical protein
MLQLQSGAADGRRRLWIASTVTAAIVMPKNRKNTKKETENENRRRVGLEEQRITLVPVRPGWLER